MKKEDLMEIEGMTEELAAKVAEKSAEELKDFIPKSRFDEQTEAKKKAENLVKERDRQMEELKKSAAGNEDLQQKISEYEKQIEALKKDAENTQKTFALKEKLAEAGVVDSDYIIYKAGGIDKFTFDGENKPVGVDDALKPYKENKAMAHLFKQETPKPEYNPNSGGAGGKANPFAKDTFNLTEQGKLLKESPEQARAMAAAAGVTI